MPCLYIMLMHDLYRLENGEAGVNREERMLTDGEDTGILIDASLALDDDD